MSMRGRFNFTFLRVYRANLTDGTLFVFPWSFEYYPAFGPYIFARARARERERGFEADGREPRGKPSS